MNERTLSPSAENPRKRSLSTSLTPRMSSQSPTMELPKIAKFKSGIHGYGVKLMEPVKKGCKICYYTGEEITESQQIRRERIYNLENIKEKYFFKTIKDTDIEVLDVIIDATKSGGVAKFINHSCNPNCKAVAGHGQIYFSALKDINAGTELTFDYQQTWHEKSSPTQCGCGAKKCRGMIEDEKSMEAKKWIYEREQHHRIANFQKHTLTIGKSSMASDEDQDEYGYVENEDLVGYGTFESEYEEDEFDPKPCTFMRLSIMQEVFEAKQWKKSRPTSQSTSKPNEYHKKGTRSVLNAAMSNIRAKLFGKRKKKKITEEERRGNLLELKRMQHQTSLDHELLMMTKINQKKDSVETKKLKTQLREYVKAVDITNYDTIVEFCNLGDANLTFIISILMTLEIREKNVTREQRTEAFQFDAHEWKEILGDREEWYKWFWKL